MLDISEVEAVGTETTQELEGINFINAENQFLTFRLGDENYGVDILSVTEIRGWESPTMIPKSPDYVMGVINLRGVIVPIIDCRILFRVGEPKYAPTTVVIVLSLRSSERTCVRGFVVDAVSDVLNAENSEIKKGPTFSGNIPSEYVQGLVNVDHDVVTILNLEQMMLLDDDDE